MKNKTFFKFENPIKYSFERTGCYYENDKYSFVFKKHNSPVELKKYAKISFIVTRFKKKDIIKNIIFDIFNINDLKINTDDLVTIYFKSDNLFKCIDFKCFSHKTYDFPYYKNNTYKFIAADINLENVDDIIKPFLDGFKNYQTFYSSIVSNGILEGEELDLKKQYEDQEQRRFKKMENLMNEMLEDAKNKREKGDNNENN